MSEETTATSGTTTESQQTQNAGTATAKTSQTTETESAKTFTQEEVNRMIAKELKPFKEIKTDYEKIQQKIKEQEDAEKTELDKLKEELDGYKPFKEKAEKLEAFATEQLESILSELSDEDKEAIESLSNPVTEKITLAKRLLAKTQTNSGGAARISSQNATQTNTVEARAREFLAARGVKEDNPLFAHQLKLTMAQLS